MKQTGIALFSTLIVIGVILPVFGDLRALPVPDLVGNAEYIVIAQVEENSPIKDPPDEQPNQKNVLKVEKVLKGSIKEADELTFLTFKPPEGVFLEDNLSFPEKGNKVIAFLKKDPDGRFFPVNGIQGIWPIDPETGKPYRMGSGYSLSDIEKSLAGEFKSK